MKDRTTRVIEATGTLAALLGATILLFIAGHSYPEWRFGGAVLLFSGLLLRIESAVRSR